VYGPEWLHEWFYRDLYDLWQNLERRVEIPPERCTWETTCHGERELTVSDTGCITVTGPPPVDACAVIARFGRASGSRTYGGRGSCFVQEAQVIQRPIECEQAPELTRSSSAVASPVSVTLFHALQGLMNQTPEGRRLAQTYWQHTGEVVGLLYDHPGQWDRAIELVQDLQPGVVALLSGNGTSFQFSQTIVDRIKALRNDLARLGSAELRAALEQESARFGDLQDFVGKDFSQWASMLGLPVPTAPVIHFSNPVWTNGQFSAEANAFPELEYSLWSAPDPHASTWQPLTNVLLQFDGYTVNVVDPDAASASNKFYRIRAQQHPSPK
jgi:hypothetical protein